MNIRSYLATAGAALCLLLTTPTSQAVEGWANTRVRETLGRGVYARPRGGDAVYVGWRLLETDGANTGFNVYRRTGSGSSQKLNSTPIIDKTTFADTAPWTGGDRYYSVKPVVNGRELAESEEYKLTYGAKGEYISFDVGGTVGKVGIGDLDGDGEYDYVVRTPDTTIDPAPGLYNPSSTSYKLKAYKSDGSFLWDFDMGLNIELGIWYAPFIVYDFDGDGFAEVAAKTAPHSPVIRDGDGRIIQATEQLSIIKDGEVVHSIDWPSSSGITETHHQCRNQIALAFLDGRTPSILAIRGTYSLIKVRAAQFHGDELSVMWNWNSNSADDPYMWRGIGAHSTRTVDLDNDGRDEVVLGSGVLDDDGDEKWTNNKRHCDHVYVGDLNPNHPGLELYYGYEDTDSVPDDLGVWDATGQILWSLPVQANHVHDEGLVSDLDPGSTGVELWSGEKYSSNRWFHTVTGVARSHKGLFFDNQTTYRAAYWDGDLQREAIVRGTVYNFPTSDVSVIYHEDFASWWGDWTIAISGGVRRAVYHDGTPVDAEVEKTTSGTWTMRLQNSVPVTSGTRYRISGFVSCWNSTHNFDLKLRGVAKSSGSTVVVSSNIFNSSPAITGTSPQTNFHREFVVPSGVTHVEPIFSGNQGVFRIHDLMIIEDPNQGRGLVTLQGDVVATADLHGDWREEIITSYGNELRIYSPSSQSSDRRVTLMQDDIYRKDVAHNAMGYGQTPTTSYFLADPVMDNKLTIAPDADALVRGGSNAGTPFGLDPQLGAKDASSDNDRRSYLRFSLAHIPVGKKIAKATLRMRVTLSDNPLNSIHLADDVWSEGTVEWNDAIPYTSTPLDTKVVPDVGEWIEFNVTNRARIESTGDGLLSLALTSTSSGNSLYSSSEGKNPPHLMLELVDDDKMVPVFADAHVFDGSPGQNYGSRTYLRARDSATQGHNIKGYLKFNVGNLPSSVSSASLLFDVMSVTPTTTGTLTIHPADDGWTESEVDWDSRPAEGSAIRVFSVEGNTMVQVDITDAVNAAASGDDVLSLSLFGANDEHRIIDMGTKEGGYPAQIIYTP